MPPNITVFNHIHILHVRMMNNQNMGDRRTFFQNRVQIRFQRLYGTGTDYTVSGDDDFRLGILNTAAHAAFRIA